MIGVKDKTMGLKTRRYTISKLERKIIKELRCLGCNALLGRHLTEKNTSDIKKIEIKCRKCKMINLFKIT